MIVGVVVGGVRVEDKFMQIHYMDIQGPNHSDIWCITLAPGAGRQQLFFYLT